MALLCVDKFTPHDANPPSTITTTNCATRRMPQTAIRRAPTTPIWHFYEKMAPKARNQPLRSHEQRNHRRHRPPTFISTIPVMVPPRGFGHRRRLRPPYQPIPQTEKVCGLRFSTRKGLGGQPPRGYVGMREGRGEARTVHTATQTNKRPPFYSCRLMIKLKGK